MKILLVSPTNSDLLHAVSVPVGLPGETSEDLLHSVNLAKSLPNNEPTFLLYGFNTLPNFSDIPEWDKKVVQGYFLWNQLFRKEYSKETKSFDMIYKHIKIVLDRVSYVGILHLPEALIKSAFPFIRFFIAAKFCKKTRARYGLD